MEQIISGDTRTTEEHTKHHLTLEEQLAQLEAKDKKAKETEARRRAKMAKLRFALLSQKREAYDKVLSEHDIQTESQLREAMTKTLLPDVVENTLPWYLSNGCLRRAAGRGFLLILPPNP